jgi:hypothetical protein
MIAATDRAKQLFFVAAIIALTQLAMLTLAPALTDETTAPPLMFLYVAFALLL